MDITAISPVEAQVPLINKALEVQRATTVELLDDSTERLNPPRVGLSINLFA